MAQEIDRVKDVEPSINLTTLGELFKIIQKDSDIYLFIILVFNLVTMNFDRVGALGVTTDEDKFLHVGRYTLGDI